MSGTLPAEFWKSSAAFLMVSALIQGSGPPRMGSQMLRDHIGVTGAHEGYVTRRGLAVAER